MPFLPSVIVELRAHVQGQQGIETVARKQGRKNAKEENSAVRRSLKGKWRKEMSTSFCVNAILKGMKLKENVRSCKR